jgi:hypothetical protein
MILVKDDEIDLTISARASVSVSNNPYNLTTEQVREYVLWHTRKLRDKLKFKTAALIQEALENGGLEQSLEKGSGKKR